jgi:peptide deformylase
MVNPEILTLEGKCSYKEGCLSVPGEAEDVERAAVVTARYLDEQGVERTITADGLLAIAIQHETDHLKGVMFVDHISSMKRELIRKRMKKVQASMAEPAPEKPEKKKGSSRSEAR